MSMGEELARGLSKLSTAALLRFISAILWLVSISLIISVMPYIPRFYLITYELRSKMISPSSLPAWFSVVATKLMISGILLIIGLIILAVSAYAFLWPAFSALRRGSEKFRISNILVKVGLLGFTFTLIGTVAVSQYIGMQIMAAFSHITSPLARALYIKKIMLTYTPIVTTLVGLQSLFALITIAGICLGLAMIAKITGSKIHYVSLALLAIGEIIYIASGAARIQSYSSPVGATAHISGLTIGLGIVSYILLLVSSILIFIGCRADIPKVRQLEETVAVTYQ